MGEEPIATDQSSHYHSAEYRTSCSKHEKQKRLATGVGNDKNAVGSLSSGPAPFEWTDYFVEQSTLR
jgi:hypothetical protein